MSDTDPVSDDEQAERVWQEAVLRNQVKQSLRDSWPFAISAAIAVTSWVLAVAFILDLPTWAAAAAWTYIAVAIVGVPLVRAVRTYQTAAPPNGTKPTTSEDVEEQLQRMDRLRARGYRDPINRRTWLRWCRVVVPRSAAAVAQLWLWWTPVAGVVYGLIALAWPLAIRAIPNYRKSLTMAEILIRPRPPAGLPTPEV
jgi:hypothetical protein